MERESILVGVTGGMGCGQTTVTKILKKCGAKVIIADLEARRILFHNKELKQELKKNFGANIFFKNGTLNRKLLGRLVFSDASKTYRLNRLVHPFIISRIIDLIAEARETGKYKLIVVDAPLIYESTMENLFDVIIVVAAKLKSRIERIKKRDQLSDREIFDRFNSQLPLEDKIKWADYVVHNNGDLNILEQKTIRIYKKLLKLFYASGKSGDG
jgi:dephospho-CoA kinase